MTAPLTWDGKPFSELTRDELEAALRDACHAYLVLESEAIVLADAVKAHGRIATPRTVSAGFTRAKLNIQKLRARLTGREIEEIFSAPTELGDKKHAG